MASSLVKFANRINSKQLLLCRNGVGGQVFVNHSYEFARNNPVTFRQNHVAVKKFIPELLCPKKAPIWLNQKITKNLSLITDDAARVNCDRNTLKLTHQRSKPLAVIVSWLLSKDKHLKKIADIYTDQEFDVLIVRITPWEVLFPEKGVLIAAKDLVDFMHVNDGYSSIVVHGFSVGGFFWCEVMIRMRENLEKYQPLVNRFRAQIWDSLVGYREMPFGVAYTFFPDNRALQWPVEAALENHMRIFEKSVTYYYRRSLKSFHETVITAPALFFVSKNDPLGAEKLCTGFRRDWTPRGIPITWKCWDNSPHVGHIVKQRK